MGIEFELKYAATPETQAAVMQIIQGDWHSISMETTYYDTPSGSLSRKRYTLRHRLENATHVCTLKTPLGRDARGEWETECEDIRAALPELCKLGAPADLETLAEEGLEAICGARFIRQACTVTFGSAVVEIALDRGILFGGSREVPLCELEVELKSGDQADAVTFAKVLAAKYGLQPQPKSKFRRAKDLREA